MQARVKKSYRWQIANACQGAEFVKYEWRPVPTGFEEQAKGLDFLETQSEVIASGEGSVTAPPVQIDPLEYLEPEQVQDTVEVVATRTAINFAKEHGIDLSQVKGSGKNGKIMMPDVKAYLEG